MQKFDMEQENEYEVITSSRAVEAGLNGICFKE
jgi:hypothetical protein